MPYDDKAEDISNQKVSVRKTVLTPGTLGIFTIRGLFMYNLVFRLNYLPIFLNESPRLLASETDRNLYDHGQKSQHRCSRYIMRCM